MFKVKESKSKSKDPLYLESEKLYYKTKPKDEVAYFSSESVTVTPIRPTPSKVKTDKRTVAQTRQTAPVGGPAVRLRSVKKPAAKRKTVAKAKTTARKTTSGKDKKTTKKK